jgi:hypothetical protein
MSKQKSVKKKQSSAGVDPAAAVMQVARVLPAVVLVSKSVRAEMRSVIGRAPVGFITLVAKMAEESGGSIAAIPIDAATTRSALAKLEHLRFGVAAARAVARYLEQEVLVLASGIAQQSLAATSSLQALARTPDGRIFAAKAAELRAAQLKGGRRHLAKQAKDTGATTTPDNGAVAKPVTVPATQS